MCDCSRSNQTPYTDKITKIVPYVRTYFELPSKYKYHGLMHREAIMYIYILVRRDIIPTGTIPGFLTDQIIFKSPMKLKENVIELIQLYKVTFHKISWEKKHGMESMIISFTIPYITTLILLIIFGLIYVSVWV